MRSWCREGTPPAAPALHEALPGSDDGTRRAGRLPYNPLSVQRVSAATGLASAHCNDLREPLTGPTNSPTVSERPDVNAAARKGAFDVEGCCAIAGLVIRDVDYWPED